MLVKEWMSTEVITVSVNESMQEAINAMKNNNIRMLPVMDGPRLAGVITDRDIKRASASDATTFDRHELGYLLEKVRVGEIMTSPAITVPQDFTLEEAANIFLTNKISGMPVVDQYGMLQGVITQTDLLKEMVALAGLSKRGLLFAFELSDDPGKIRELVGLIRDFGGRMVSILTSYSKADDGLRKVYIRMYGLDRTTLPRLKDKLQKTARLLYLVDLRDNKREIY